MIETLVALGYKVGVPVAGGLLVVQEVAASEPVLGVLLFGAVAAALTSIGVMLTKAGRSIKGLYDKITDFVEEVLERLKRLESRTARIERHLGIPYDEKEL